MNYVDILLLLILGYFIYKGFRVGFVRIIGGFIGIVAGAYIAGRLYDVGAGFLIDRFPDLNWATALVFSFIIIYIAVNIIVALVVRIITAIFHIIPLATTVNHIIGALLGALQALLLIGLLIWVATLFPVQNKFVDALRESQVAGYFESSTQLVQPLLPEGLRNLNFETLQSLQDASNAKAEYLKQHIPPNFFKRVQEQTDELENRVQEEIDKESKPATTPSST